MFIYCRKRHCYKAVLLNIHQITVLKAEVALNDNYASVIFMASH